MKMERVLEGRDNMEENDNNKNQNQKSEKKKKERGKKGEKRCMIGILCMEKKNVPKLLESLRKLKWSPLTFL